MQSKLDAAEEELKTLRSNLSKAEAKESRAREEHSRTAEDMRVKLERTASEVRIYIYICILGSTTPLSARGLNFVFRDHCGLNINCLEASRFAKWCNLRIVC